MGAAMAGRVSAGDLTRRVQFMRALQVDDGFSVAEAFQAHGSPVWALRSDVSDAERWRAGEVQANIAARFVIRSSAFSRGITPKDRLVCDGLVFDIVGVKEVAGGRAFLEMTCAARADL